MAKVVLDSWHFTFSCGVPIYKCSAPSRIFHGFCSPFKNFKICACGIYAHLTSIIYAPPCQTSFLHIKSMLLKVDFLGFWISIDWDFETWPMFQTMLWTDCIRKNGKLIVATLLWESVKMKFTLPKLGLGNPLGLPKLQNSITRVKTPCIGVFFISIESYQSVDVENRLTCPFGHLQHKLW
jgi:hypothetical protein